MRICIFAYAIYAHTKLNIMHACAYNLYIDAHIVNMLRNASKAGGHSLSGSVEAEGFCFV